VLIETLEILSHGDLVREIGQAMDEARRGDVLTTDDVLDGMRAADRRVPPSAT
jgi:hypothetical protein